MICDTRSRRKCHTYNTSKTIHFQRNKIKRTYLERERRTNWGLSDLIHREIGNNINILLSFCCLTLNGCWNSPLHSLCTRSRRKFQREEGTCNLQPANYTLRLIRDGLRSEFLRAFIEGMPLAMPFNDDIFSRNGLISEVCHLPDDITIKALILLIKPG